MKRPQVTRSPNQQAARQATKREERDSHPQPVSKELAAYDYRMKVFLALMTVGIRQTTPGPWFGPPRRRSSFYAPVASLR